MFEGRVEAIAIRKVKSGVIEHVTTTSAEAGRGLAGDYLVQGLLPGVENLPEKQITLIEAEAIEAVRGENNLEFSHLESRRNVLTRGVPLNHLVGKRFRVGALLLEGQELCEPCSHLEKLTGKTLIRPLLHRCGLRARIVEGGPLQVGDLIHEA